MTEQDNGLPEPTGKVALVTGASRGIGYGIAEALVARGDRVVITGRNEDALKEAAEKLGADRVLGVAGKAHDEAHQAVAVERAMEAFGRIDYLVNNAGTNPVFGPIAGSIVAAYLTGTNFLDSKPELKQLEQVQTHEDPGAPFGLNPVPDFGRDAIRGARFADRARETQQEQSPNGPRAISHRSLPVQGPTAAPTKIGRHDASSGCDLDQCVVETASTERRFGPVIEQAMCHG